MSNEIEISLFWCTQFEIHTYEGFSKKIMGNVYYEKTMLGFQFFLASNLSFNSMIPHTL